MDLVDGYEARRLIAAIINQAIEDGMQFKRPRLRFVKLEVYKRKYEKERSIFISLIMTFSHIKDISLIEFFIKLISKISLITPAKFIAERECLTARNFFNSKNPLFNLYANFLDLEPEFLAEKVHEYFYKFDQGLAPKRYKLT
jgi:hypothetical protein